MPVSYTHLVVSDEDCNNITFMLESNVNVFIFDNDINLIYRSSDLSLIHI